jgi:hypothetical protein
VMFFWREFGCLGFGQWHVCTIGRGYKFMRIAARLQTRAHLTNG